MSNRVETCDEKFLQWFWGLCIIIIVSLMYQKSLRNMGWRKYIENVSSYILTYLIRGLFSQINHRKEFNMLSIVKSMALNGLNGYLVDVQIDVASGLPHWEIVGLPDASVRESKERVRTAIKNSGIEFPSRKITVNLAPANTRKEGSFFDLPIAIGILMATENLNDINIQDTIFMGELSLDGSLNKINGVLPMCIEALKLGIKRAILPIQNAKEASVVQGLEVIGVKSLEQTIKFLLKQENIKTETINIENMLVEQCKYNMDFAEVKGQENVKRALEIAAAGRPQLRFDWFAGLWQDNAC